jgi:AraC-like DNA-binding protein
MESLADIAARYGATVAPGVTVQHLPIGASALPLPVWDGKKLIVPDWQEQRKALQASGVRRARAKAKVAKAEDDAMLQRLLDLHSAGATNAAIAQACGISESYCRAMLSRNGRTANRDPSHQAAVVERRRAAGQAAFKAKTARRHAQITQMARDGASLQAIADATGLTHGQHLRRLVAKLAPDQAARFRAPPAPRAPRRSQAEVKAERIRALVKDGAGIERIAAELGMKPGRHLRRMINRAVPDFTPGPGYRTDLAERDRLVVRLYPDMCKAAIAEKLGLTLGHITASVKRARAAGLLPQVSEAPPPKRIKRRPKGLVYHGHRNDQILDLHRTGLTIEAIMAEVGLGRNSVARVLWAAGESVRNERCSKMAARLAELPDLIAQRMDGAAIAARWGVTLGTVYQIAHRAKVALNGRKDPHNRGAVSPKVAARRELVRGLFLKGMLQVDMLDLLKVSHATLSSDIKALGLSGQSPNSLQAKKAARDAKGERRAA